MVPLHTPWPVVLKQGHPFPPEPDCTGVPELQMYQSVVHWYEHVPLEQVWFLVNGRLLQSTAPDPQAQGLLLGGRHAPLQSDVPPGQAQVPLTHVVPDGQTVVHEPQWFGSLANVTQAPLHVVWPGGHVEVQTPLAHTSPEGQAVPHVPQLAGSLDRFTQAPEQLVCPAAHCEPQVPFEQTSPAGQVVPHVPQLAGSLARVTQAPEHTVCPEGHWAVH
jgi:hypothetical protein